MPDQRPRRTLDEAHQGWMRPFTEEELATLNDEELAARDGLTPEVVARILDAV